MYKIPKFENSPNYYDLNRTQALYSWSQGDNTTIELYIPEYEDYEDIEVNFYTYKDSNLVYNVSITPNNPLEINITTDVSQLFKQGLYNIEVIGINEENQIRKTIYNKLNNYVEVL